MYVNDVFYSFLRLNQARIINPIIINKGVNKDQTEFFSDLSQASSSPTAKAGMAIKANSNVLYNFFIL